MGGLSDWLTEAQPINRKNAAEAVFDDIRSAITSGQLAVGTRLPAESNLAVRYGVSRPIIREALRSLQTLGLTQTRTGSGTYVMTPTPPSELNYGAYSARDLIEARPFIEVPAAGWAAVRRTDAQLAALLDLCDRMDAEERPHPWVLLDGQFHCAIAEASFGQWTIRQGGGRCPRSAFPAVRDGQSDGGPPCRLEFRAPPDRRGDPAEFSTRGA